MTKVFRKPSYFNVQFGEVDLKKEVSFLEEKNLHHRPGIQWEKIITIQVKLMQLKFFKCKTKAQNKANINFRSKLCIPY